MKKIISSLLVLGIMSLMTIPAFATSNTQNMDSPGNKQIDVEAKYTDSGANPTVYSVDLEWGDMEFTYTVGGTNVWNPDTHTYSNSATPVWTASGNTVVVTNHSNKDIGATFAFTKTVSDNLAGSFSYTKASTNNRVTLNAGVEGQYNSADKVTATLNLSGTITNSYNVFSKVGTITITLG